MIPMEELDKGAYYKGEAERLGPMVCMWNGEMFLYFRFKFGEWMTDYIHHELDPERPHNIVGFTPEEMIV